MSRAVNSPLINRAVKTVVRGEKGRRWLSLQGNKLRVRMGKRLVPESGLQALQTEHLHWLIEREGAANLGDYLEFGVFCGTSMSCMWRALEQAGLQQVRLFGFDSFEGFPAIAATDDEGFWPPGGDYMDESFTRRYLTRRGVDWSRVFLTKGWFCDTLTPELVQRHRIKKASVMMMDCDLYTSTKDALTFCGPLIQDYAVIIFDDWFSGRLAQRGLGQKKAFDEFQAAFPNLTARSFPGYNENSIIYRIVRQGRPAE